MRAKHFIFSCILLLSLTIANTKQAISDVTTVAVPDRAAHTTQWKSIPQDSSSWRREPFKSTVESKRLAAVPIKQIPQSSLATSSPDLALQGIMKSNQHYYAIINNRTVKPGEQIEGWTIAEISRYRVTIHREKEKQMYDIYQGRIDRGTR